MDQFCKLHQHWLKNYFQLPHAIPSQDTFCRVFSAVDPIAFQEFFLSGIGNRSIYTAIPAENQEKINIKNGLVKKDNENISLKNNINQADRDPSGVDTIYITSVIKIFAQDKN